MGNAPSFKCKSAPLSKAGQLRMEKSILADLRNCSWVVDVIDDFIKQEMNGEDTYHLHLEYVRGGRLSKRIKKLAAGRMQEIDVRWCTKCLLMALFRLHGKGYVHCDLNPDNIFVELTGSLVAVKIGNFERAVGSGGYKKKGDLRGKHHFMSPEVVTEGAYYPPADVWALGCCIVVMMTGKLPWSTCKNVDDVLFQIGYTDELPDIPDNLSIRGKDFLRRCFEKDPSKRWTAHKLMKHPFVLIIDIDEEDEEITATTNQDKEKELIQSNDYKSLVCLLLSYYIVVAMRVWNNY